MTYGVGRTIEYDDMPDRPAIVREAAREDYRFSAIVLGIVRSAQFHAGAPRAATGRQTADRSERHGRAGGAGVAEIDSADVRRFRYVHHQEAPARRTFLRGLGASLSLPLLDAMIPAGTALAQTAAAPQPKIGFFYFPHGAVISNGCPPTTGRDFDLPQILAPFAAFKDQMTVVSGLRNKAAEGAGVHTVNPGTWLSCTSPAGRGRRCEQRVTADQTRGASDRSGHAVSVVGAVHEKLRAAVLAARIRVRFRTTVSFRGVTRPLPMEHNPRKLFYRLFGQGDTAEEREAIVSQTDSLLDLVADSAASRARQARTRRTGCAWSSISTPYVTSTARCRSARIKIFAGSDLPDAPAGVPAAFDDHIKLMFDLPALAFQAGLTRVVTFMMAAEISMLTYNQVGISEAFHPLSHHQNNRTRWHGSRSCRPITPQSSPDSSTSSRTPRMGTARCSTIRSCSTAAT